MAIYRNIHLSFWTDPKVTDDFTPEDKYFFLYLLTNPHTNICGCYEISMKQISDETGYTPETVRKLIDRMDHVHKVIRYSRETKEIYILNWHKYNWTESEKVLFSVHKNALEIKEKSFKSAVLDTLCIGYAYPMDTTDTVYSLESKLNLNTKLNYKYKDKSLVHKDKSSNKDLKTIKKIVDHLNKVCGTRYKYQTAKTQAHIRARLNEGFTLDDFFLVIDKKHEEWEDDPMMSKYLRPETLFGTKFEGYLNQKQVMSIEDEMKGWV